MSNVVQLNPPCTGPVLIQRGHQPGFSIPRPPSPVLVSSRGTVILDPEKLRKVRDGHNWVLSLFGNKR